MRLLIMGPPGVGKGTQAKGIAAYFAIPAISTGDIFRQNVKDKTPLGLEVARIMEAGGYVPDEITDSIVADRLTQADAATGWLLDGYPRTLGQVEALDQVLADTNTAIDAVISLVAEQEPLVERLLKRAEVEGRADDTAETIKKRMEVYNEATDPLLAIYRERGFLVEVDGMGTIDEVWLNISTALDVRLP